MMPISIETCGWCVSLLVAWCAAGTVSLMLSQNDDYPDLKQAREYRNMQFLITTGPGNPFCFEVKHSQSPMVDVTSPGSGCWVGLGHVSLSV